MTSRLSRTVLCVIFTIETWLVIYPAFSIFHKIELLQATLVMAPWFPLLLIGLGFQLHLAVGRRLGALFE